MSIKIMSQVWETDIGPATKRLVLLAIADSANDEGVCWPSVATLARKAGASRRRVEEVLAELHTEGVVTRSQRFNDTNVYQVHVDQLAPREICTPRENDGESPAKNNSTPRENPQGNRKRTINEPTTPPAGGSSTAPPPVPAASGADHPEDRTPNQRAVLLAQAHYERLGKMGNVPSMMKIIRKALEHGYSDEAVDRACTYIADHRWTLTEEKLANTLRGGPLRPTGPAPAPEPRHPASAGTRPAGARPPGRTTVQGV